MRTGFGDALDKALNGTDELLDEVRRVTHDLRPDGLMFGLEHAIKQMAEPFQRVAEIDVQSSGDPDTIVGAHHVLRTIQEAITNAIRHGKAKRIDVRLRFRPQSLVVSIQDDGKGINSISNTTGATGVGIKSMRERAELLGGRIDFASAGDHGTLITLEVPKT